MAGMVARLLSALFPLLVAGVAEAKAKTALTALAAAVPGSRAVAVAAWGEGAFILQLLAEYVLAVLDQ
jgi:hypothetical protein